MRIKTVFFDVGETLVSEVGYWAAWAERLGVTPLTMSAAIGAMIARGEPHWRALLLVQPGLDLDQARRRWQVGGWWGEIGASDLYPDAVPCLTALKARGYRVGIAGNQPQGCVTALERLGVPADVVGSSAGWGVEKPSPGFFARVIEASGHAAGEVAYVGDRLDNDVLPALAAGMVGVFLRRGPWGVIQAADPEVSRANLRLESLAELPEALDRF